jgi:hypothetical protein
MKDHEHVAIVRPAILRPNPMIAALAVIVLLVLVWLVVRQVDQLPPANTDYNVTISPGVRPATRNGTIAAIARHYLDAQTADLAAPNLHRAPVVISATVLPARDARQLEPGIPPAQVSEQPDRVVWVVRASGDFLDLHDLPWSSAGDPYPQGNIVIDDATGTLLGVYPHAAGT